MENISLQLKQEVWHNNILNVQRIIKDYKIKNINNFLDDHGSSPLHFAHTLDMVRYLVKIGADVNHKDNYGFTPLHNMDDMGDIMVNVDDKLEILNYLIDHGADVNCKNNMGNTPLYTADANVTRYLLEHGANPNVKNIDGDTPLHYCCGKIKKVKLLLDNGADMHIKNNKNKSAYDCVVESNNTEIMKLFENYDWCLDIKEPSDD